MVTKNRFRRFLTVNDRHSLKKELTEVSIYRPGKTMKNAISKKVFGQCFQSLLPSSCHDSGCSSFFAACIHIGLAVLFFLGAMIAFFSIMTVKMLFIAAGIGIAIWFFRDRLLFFCKLTDIIRRNPIASVCLVVVIGLVLRALFYYVHLGTMLLENQTNDCLIFLNEAKEMASGSFPETKSWVTVGCYALLIRLFGESVLPLCLLNNLLQILSLVLIYFLGRRMFNSLVAVFAVMAYYWSPMFIPFSFSLQAEHFFYPLVLLQFLLLALWSEKNNLLYAAAMGLTILATLWTKTDAGVFIAVITLFVFLTDAILKRRIRAVLFSLSVLSVIVVAGLCWSSAINQKYHGTHTFLCSQDGYWPQYFGANAANKGRVKMKDKLAMYEAYEKDTGEKLVFRHNHCPSVLVPYIRAEIHRRWSSMTFKTKIELIYQKEAFSWQTLCNPVYRTQLFAKAHTILKVLVWLTACLALLRLSCRALRFPNVTSVDILRVLPVLYLIGMFLCLILVEANFRYTMCANVFLPFYFGYFIYWLKCRYQSRREHRNN